MYHAFYSLNSTPFSKEIKAKDAFFSDAFSEACSRLEFLKKTRGIGMLTGEPGAGKTLLSTIYWYRDGILPWYCQGAL